MIFMTETIIKYCSTTEIMKVSVYKYFELESIPTSVDIILINNYKSATQKGNKIVLDQSTLTKCLQTDFIIK